jgi:serine protease Do
MARLKEQEQRKNEKLRIEVARLKKQNQPKPKKVAKKKQKPKPSSKSATSGSGFFVSKKGHVITNQHVVSNCKTVTIGDNSKKQVTADILETDRRNDLALLKISSLKMASVETKSLIKKLGITVVPLASDGLMRSEDVELGEDVLVSGYPYGEIFSNSIKVTKGIVSANRGLGDDTGQFQIDAAVQPGNSGGPIYDENGNIVGVVVAQLNKRKFEKMVGSMPENVNFGIKASTVRQFLNASGLPTKWSKRSKRMNTRELAKIAKNQTVMVMCHR